MANIRLTFQKPDETEAHEILTQNYDKDDKDENDLASEDRYTIFYFSCFGCFVNLGSRVSLIYLVINIFIIDINKKN